MAKRETPQNRTDRPEDFAAGQRSITGNIGTSRFDILREKKQRSVKGRPYLIAGIILLVLILLIPTVAFINQFIIPPRQLAIRVGDATYNRGDVVEMIRFNQRLSEDTGLEFSLGKSVFEILQTIQDAELSYQVGPSYGIAIDPEEIDFRMEFLLGFMAWSPEERTTSEYMDSLDEAKKQFLNKVRMPEEFWRDLVKKALFQERLRELVGDTVDRIQPQIHVYEIQLPRNDPQLHSAIDRDLLSGATTEEVVFEYSVDPNVRRGRGDLGWFPEGVAIEIEDLLWGLDADGNRLFPLNRASPPKYNQDTETWTVLILDEYQEARQIEESKFELVVDSAMNSFLNSERAKFVEDGKFYLDLDSEIAAWIGKQVHLASLAPTPAPQGGQYDQTLRQLGLGAKDPTPVPTPRGIPGISVPVK